MIKENITVYRYFIKSTYQVRYIDQVIEGKKSGTILQSVKKVKEYQEIANGAELGTDTKKHKYYKGYQLSNTTSVLVDSNAVCVYRYFVPVRYSIHFDGMEPSNGIMRDIESCEYLENITLPKNVYQKKIQLRLHLNCEDAIATAMNPFILQFFLAGPKQQVVMWNSWIRHKWQNFVIQSRKK